jgi:S-adenosylmethionine:tRNA ribosyltransferase-isomerase
VGAGTFKPVKAEKLENHEMHAEFIEVSLSTINLLIESLNDTVVAVGTTSLRTIESLYWIGFKILQDPQLPIEKMVVQQWEPYKQYDIMYGVKESLEAIAQWMSDHQTDKIITKTQILIAPGYSFKIVRGLVTNFHQPKSTLLLLIAALIGKEWKEVYQYALENEFRFLSYGDGCLLWNDAAKKQ